MPLIPQTTKNIRAWSSFISSIRKHMENQGFIEVSTPALVRVGAFESSLDPLQVSWSQGKAELHTSPEIAMKSILSQIEEPIYQICHCFRDDFEGVHHSIEFTMLEFYRKKLTYEGLILEVKALLGALSPQPLLFEMLTVEEAFQKYAGLSLRDISARGSDTWEDSFFRVMLDKVEPALNREIPTFLVNYPVSVSPLSQQIEGTQTAERFELYWRGMELCNGCTEIADAAELEKRYIAESEKRKAAGKPPHPCSPELVKATKNLGMVSGVAVGLERLFIALNNTAEFD